MFNKKSLIIGAALLAGANNAAAEQTSLSVKTDPLPNGCAEFCEK